MKLRIKEDTSCIPAKTSYINTGRDKNGIYYFGKKPNLPISWRDYKRINKKRKKDVFEMVIKESYEDEVRRYFEVDSKKVNDSDGFTTDYTMYEEYVIPKDDWFSFLRNYKGGEKSPYELMDKWFTRYVFIFGDKELYNPNDGYDDFDFECETEEEATDWFDNYEGFDIEDDYVDESLNGKKLSESIAEDSGVFTMLDDEVGNFEGNMPEEDIDKAIGYLQRVSKILKAGFSDITYYGCNEDYLSPLAKKNDFKLKQIYKNGKYDAYVGEFNGKPFVIDHFDTRRSFGMYAKDENTIKDIIEYMENSY